MKAEIALIMGVVLSIIKRHGEVSFDLMLNKSRTVRFEEYEWKFSKTPSELRYECWLHYPFQGRISQSLLFANGVFFGGIGRLSLTHKGVGALLKALMKDPVILEQFLPFLEASEI